MDLMLLIPILFISLVLYIIFTSYTFQVFLHKSKYKKKFLNEFAPKVKGKYYEEAFYSETGPIILRYEFKGLPKREQVNLFKCYNVVTFRTPDANWELFFSLVKEGIFFKEVMMVRVFPLQKRIRSEASIEKTHSLVNVLANNRYLSEVLEDAELKDTFKWLLRKNRDMLHIMHNNMNYKIMIGEGKKITVSRLLDIVRSLHTIKNRIYRREVLEY